MSTVTGGTCTDAIVKDGVFEKIRIAELCVFLGYKLKIIL